MFILYYFFLSLCDENSSINLHEFSRNWYYFRQPTNFLRAFRTIDSAQNMELVFSDTEEVPTDFNYAPLVGALEHVHSGADRQGSYIACCIVRITISWQVASINKVGHCGSAVHVVYTVQPNTARCCNHQSPPFLFYYLITTALVPMYYPSMMEALVSCMPGSKPWTTWTAVGQFLVVITMLPRYCFQRMIPPWSKKENRLVPFRTWQASLEHIWTVRAHFGLEWGGKNVLPSD